MERLTERILLGAVIFFAALFFMVTLFFSSRTEKTVALVPVRLVGEYSVDG